MIGLYQPGRSWLHRTPVVLKLMVLAILVVGMFLLRQPWQIGVALVTVVLLAASCQLSPQLLWRNVRPLRWFVPLLFAFQWIFVGWERALLTTGALVVNVLLAALFTMTTPVEKVLDFAERALGPLRRFGVNPERVGLLLALTIRCIPLLSEIMTEVLAARKARGITGIRDSLRAVAAPVLIRTIRMADGFGDALVARGLDD